MISVSTRCVVKKTSHFFYLHVVFSLYEVVLLRLRLIKKKRSCATRWLCTGLLIGISNDTVWSTKIIGNQCEWLHVNYEY